MRRDDALQPIPAAPADPPDEDGLEPVDDKEEPTGPREAVTGRPDQGVSRRTGPGTGGATETAGRMPHHEGVHARRSAKG